eukprot:TRINITY_DN61080_c0_g1_i1.p1 TRINITY_DN61080_c0_g1~~TRINITY_DN61080_c0_g1_i1.p1  ORF type:complete len:356 (+),score=48.57 TRINITY_DN61080_c0_g1_i1:59-1126(+)
MDLVAEHPHGQKRQWKRQPRPLVYCLIIGSLLVTLSYYGLHWFRHTESLHDVQTAIDNSTGAPPRMDVVFVIDATSSMQPYIDDAKSNVMAIGTQLALHKSAPVLRFGAVFYRDITDVEVVREVPLTSDVQAVRQEISKVQAQGGGDWREHIGLGLHKALAMDWTGSIRLIYLVADAPANTYADGYDVESAVRKAKELGVKIHVVGVNDGLREGKAEVAAIASATGGTFHNLEMQVDGQRPGRSEKASPARSAPRKKRHMSHRSEPPEEKGALSSVARESPSPAPTIPITVLPSMTRLAAAPSSLAFKEAAYHAEIEEAQDDNDEAAAPEGDDTMLGALNSKMASYLYESMHEEL